MQGSSHIYFYVAYNLEGNLHKVQKHLTNNGWNFYHEHKLHLMAQELLEHETIDESDIKVLVSGKKIIKK